MVVLLFCENDNRCNGKAKLPPGYRQPAYLVGSMIPLASITACKPCRQPGAFQFLFLSNLLYKCHSSVRFLGDRACSLVGRLWGPSQNLRLTLLEAAADLLLWNLRCVYRIISIIIHLWKPFSFQFQLFKIFFQMVACLLLPLFWMYCNVSFSPTAHEIFPMPLAVTQPQSMTENSTISSILNSSIYMGSSWNATGLCRCYFWCWHLW